MEATESPARPSAAEAFRDLSLPKKIFIIVVAAFILFYGGGWLYERFLKSEEDKIRSALAASIEGANARSPSDVTEILADDFKGSRGIDKSIAHQAMIILLMRTYRVVDVSIAPQPVPVTLGSDGRTASATFTVSARGKAEEHSAWEDMADAFTVGNRFSVSFRKDEKKGWQIVRLDIGGEEQ